MDFSSLISGHLVARNGLGTAMWHALLLAFHYFTVAIRGIACRRLRAAAMLAWALAGV